MNGHVSTDCAAFLQHDRSRANVAFDRRCRLHFDASTHRQRAAYAPANHHLTRFDISNDNATGGNYESIGTMERSLDFSVDRY